MKAEFDDHGVRVVALSIDEPEHAHIHKDRDGLSMTLLSDPSLEVIRRYGVEHHKAFGGTTGRFMLFGIPLVFIVKSKPMAIPTTLLIDEHGVIRWIDQSDDYRVRSDETRVSEATRAIFGGPRAAAA